MRVGGCAGSRVRARKLAHVYVRVRARAREHTCGRMRAYVRVHACIRAGACVRTACVGERYGVSRGVIRRIAPRGTAYLSYTHARRVHAPARPRVRECVLARARVHVRVREKGIVDRGEGGLLDYGVCGGWCSALRCGQAAADGYRIWAFRLFGGMV